MQLRIFFDRWFHSSSSIKILNQTNSKLHLAWVLSNFKCNSSNNSNSNNNNFSNNNISLIYNNNINNSYCSPPILHRLTLINSRFNNSSRWEVLKIYHSNSPNFNKIPKKLKTKQIIILICSNRFKCWETNNNSNSNNSLVKPCLVWMCNSRLILMQIHNRTLESNKIIIKCCSKHLNLNRAIINTLYPVIYFF